VAAVCFHVGRVGLGLSAVLLVAGTWVGVKATSADEADCRRTAREQGLHGSAKADFVRSCIEDSRRPARAPEGSPEAPSLSPASLTAPVSGCGRVGSGGSA
jgi:hypothetical protein